MRYRRIDPQTQDYMFGNGLSDWWINQPEAVGQAIYTRLMLWQGQWFYDVTEGTPWQTEVLGERTQATRDVVVRERVQDTPEVVAITAYGSVVNPNTRTFAAQVAVNSAYGPVAVAAPRLPGTVPPLPPRTDRAQVLGILSGQTPIAMTPAPLTVSGRTDITQFNVLQMDAGEYP